MPRHLFAASVVAASVVIGPHAALAQGCTETSADGTGASREAAMRAAYETVLRTTSPALLQTWSASGGRIGEAPGFTVRKLNTKCSAGGQGQICRLEVTLCRN